MTEETFKYHWHNQPIPEGWVKVHDFMGSNWKEYCHHGHYGVLIKKVKEEEKQPCQNPE